MNKIALIGATALLSTNVALAKPVDRSVVDKNLQTVKDKIAAVQSKPAKNLKKIKKNKKKIKALEGQVADLESRVALLESVPGTEFDFRVSLNCNDNPNALREAYAENVNRLQIAFDIEGLCYGNLGTTVDADGNLISTQVHNQSILISGNPEVESGLIPYPATGETVIWATFGGGLYLNDITYQLGENYDLGPAYSRNGHGGLTNVTINGPGTGFGIFVQEGAQAYLFNVNVSGVSTALMGIGNSSIRLLGNNSFVGSDIGMALSGASTVRAQGELNYFEAQYNAINLDSDSSVWSNYGTLEANGSVDFYNNSSLVADVFNVSNSMTLQHSYLRANTLTVPGNFHADTSTVTTYGGQIGSVPENWSGSVSNSKLQFNGNLVGQFSAEHNSSVTLASNGFLDGHLQVTDSHLHYSYINLPTEGQITCNGNSVVVLPDPNLSPSEILPNSGCFNSNEVQDLRNWVKSQMSGGF